MSFGKNTYGKPIIHWDNGKAKLIVGKYCQISRKCKHILRRKS
jgi:hypothetical protein